MTEPPRRPSSSFLNIRITVTSVLPLHLFWLTFPFIIGQYFPASLRIALVGCLALFNFVTVLKQFGYDVTLHSSSQVSYVWVWVSYVWVSQICMFIIVFITFEILSPTFYLKHIPSSYSLGTHLNFCHATLGCLTAHLYSFLLFCFLELILLHLDTFSW